MAGNQIPKGGGPLKPFNDRMRRRLERSERAKAVLARRARLERELVSTSEHKRAHATAD